jgi:hypothetical protein
MKLGVFAEESNESSAIDKHVQVLLFCSDVSRGTKERARTLLKPRSAFFGGTAKA